MSYRRAVLDAARSPVASARVAAWAWAEARRLAGALGRDGIAAVGAIRPPPATATGNRSTVAVALRLAGATCLERSAVLQRWDADHDAPRALVVGVARDPDGCFAAHAWLEGDDDGAGFVELHRHLPG